MKLKYKITSSIVLVSLSILFMVSYIYSTQAYEYTVAHEKENLLENVVDSTHHIKSELIDKLANALTMASSPIVYQTLEKSNNDYKLLSDNQIDEYINNLNQTWRSADSIEDSFVKPYLNNKLALFLKKQQSILPDVYGELFITNQHGAMIATTGKLTTLKHSHKYWWKESFADGNGKVFFDDRGFDTSVNGYVIGIVIPIKKGTEVLGILKVNINIIGTLKRLIDEHEEREHGSLKIVRTNGLIVYGSGLTPLSKKVDSTFVENILKNNETQTVLLKNKSQEFFVAHAPLSLSYFGKELAFGGKAKTLGSSKGNEGEIWHTIITYDKDLALAGVKETNIFIVYVGLFIIFFAALLSYIIGLMISKPIDALAQSQQKLLAQEKIMIAQSRHAAMGEMISMIAHQWRQPISVISMAANNIMADIELEITDDKNLRTLTQNILTKTQELSKTIDDFGSFFSTNKQKELTKVDDIIEETFELIGKSLEYNSIEVRKEYASETEILIYSRELLQVLVNIVKNAKEALVDSETQEALISVRTREDTHNIYISICNNGKNIPDDIIDKLYDPYFSTKREKNATGLGLYMSKVIIEQHFDGKIDIINQGAEGVCFLITLNKANS